MDNRTLTSSFVIPKKNLKVMSQLEMSFNDWKQYKNALPNPTPLPPPPPPPPKLKNYTQSVKRFTNNMQESFRNYQKRVTISSAPKLAKPATPMAMNKKPQINLNQRNNTQRSAPQLHAIKPAVNNKQIVSNCQITASKVSSAQKSGPSNWILKPLPPPMSAVTPESKEEKQRMWRDYRQAMKPFKNREFANAKRTIQRLSKRELKELDEKELLRLQKAKEIVASHKAMLCQKTAMRTIRAQNRLTKNKTNTRGSNVIGDVAARESHSIVFNVNNQSWSNNYNPQVGQSNAQVYVNHTIMPWSKFQNGRNSDDYNRNFPAPLPASGLNMHLGLSRQRTHVGANNLTGYKTNSNYFPQMMR